MTTTQYQGRFTVDGIPYTSVFSILKTDIKLAQSKRSAALSKSSSKKLKNKSATSRGIAVHAAVRQFLNTGDCDLAPEYYPYFDGIYDWLSRLDLDTWWAEGPMLDELQHLRNGPSAAVWCKNTRYIGIPDWAGTIGGVPCVVEFKTSDHLYRSTYNHKQFKQYYEWVKYNSAAQQTATYANAWTETTGMPIETGIVINSTPDDVQLFIIEKDEMKKKLSSFHKLVKDYRSIHG